MNRFPIPLRPLLAAAPLALAACLGPDDKESRALPDAAFVFATTVSDDYKTGSYSAYGMGTGTLIKNIEANHSDAVVRFRGGSDIFVINRTGRDNLLVVDRNNLKVVMTVKFPALSNPQDIEAKDGLLYASFLAYDSILIYDQSNGNRVGAIDLHAYADDDGLAEIAALRFAGEYLYALVQNLDTQDPLWAPHADPKLLKIDVKKREVAEAIVLPFPNPMGIAYAPGSGRLYIPCAGVNLNAEWIPELDGAMVEVDLASGKTRSIALEKDLGGTVTTPETYEGKLIFTVQGAGDDRVIAIDPAGEILDTVATLPAYGARSLAADPESNTLCVADAKKGLRFFRLDTFAEKDTTSIGLGLSPNDIAVIR